MGPPKAYGQRPYTVFPTKKEMLKSIKLRERGSDAFVERLPLRKAALTMKNRILFDLEALNSPRIFSGKDKWLFYKDQFRNYDCMAEKRLKIALERLDVLSSMSELTGPRVLYSISPNKYSIYNDKGGSSGIKFSNCYEQNKNLLKQRIQSWDQSNIILHHNALRNARARGLLAFRPHDTHWSELGGLYAFDDILNWLGYTGEKLKDNLKFHALSDITNSDLGNTMLLLDNGTDTNFVPETSEVSSFAKSNLLPKEKILILHDSFYQKISPHIDILLPNVMRLHYARDIKKIPDIIQNLNIVVVNIVERSFAIHLTTKTMGWDSPLGQEILRRNENAARECEWGNLPNWLKNPEPKIVQYFNLEIDSNKLIKPKNTDPIIVFDISELNPGNGLCAEIELKTPSDTRFEVFLQSREWPKIGNRWITGRSFYKDIKKGPQKIQIVIPTNKHTKYIRIDPVSSHEEFSVYSAKFTEYRPNISK